MKAITIIDTVKESKKPKYSPEFVNFAYRFFSPSTSIDGRGIITVEVPFEEMDEYFRALTYRP